MRKNVVQTQFNSHEINGNNITMSCNLAMHTQTEDLRHAEYSIDFNLNGGVTKQNEILL